MSLLFLARHQLNQSRLRTSLSALAVALGVGMVIAASLTASGIRNASQSGDNTMGWLTDAIEIGLQVIGLVILMAAGFLIFNAFAMSVTQRRRQVGLLRSLGMTRRQVLEQVLAEALITGGLGSLLGLGAGLSFGLGLLSLMRQVGIGVGRGELAPADVALALGMGLGISLLSALIPAWGAARTSPLLALRPLAPSADERTPLRYAALGVLVILSLTTYLALAPPGRWTGLHPPWEWLSFLILIWPWLGALALVSPALIEGLGRIVGRASGLGRYPSVTGRLMADNLGRDRRRVSLTALTLAVGLTVIVGQTGFLHFSNRILVPRAAQGVLGRTTWFIYPFDRSNGLAQLDEFNQDLGLSQAVLQDARRLVAGRAEISQSHMVVVPAISSPMFGFPSIITDLNSLTRPGTYTFVEGSWETARPIMEAGCGLLLPPTVAARNRVGLGDSLTLTGRAGPVACRVAGIGYGGTVPMSIISPAAREAFVDGPPLSLAIWPLPGADVNALEADLQALAERHGDDAWLTTPQQEIQSILDTSDQIQAMTNGLLVLAVVAAALGVVNTTMMSVTERRPELGLLRAVGATRRQVTAVVVGEAALIGLVGGGLGVIAGSGLTAIFCLCFGGIPFGLIDLNLWPATWQSVQVTLQSGSIGLLVTPLVSAGAAWLTVRPSLRGSAIEALQIES